MKILTRFFVGLALFTVISPSFGEGGSTDIGGGGQVVVIDGVTRLRDLVDEHNCFWLDGVSATERVPHFLEILAAVDEVHPNLTAHLQEELRQVAVCELSGPLRRIDASDSQQSVVDTTETGETIALRWNEKIFVDRTLFDRLNAVDQAYLYFHELMHRFIAMNVPQRNLALRSFVAAVRRYEQERFSFDVFALQARINSVSVRLWSLAEARAFRGLRDLTPDSAFADRVSWYRQFAGCDLALEEFPASWRTPRELRAYRISRAFAPQANSCLRLGSSEPEIAWMSALCAADDERELREIDGIFHASAGNGRDEEANARWLDSVVFFELNVFGRPPSGLGDYATEFGQTLDAFRGPCQAKHSWIRGAIRYRIAELRGRVPHGREWITSLARAIRKEPLNPNSEIAVQLASLAYIGDVEGDEHHVSALIEGARAFASQTELQAIADWSIRASQGSLLPDADNHRTLVEIHGFLPAELWAEIVRRSPLDWQAVIRAHATEKLPFESVRIAARARGVSDSELCRSIGQFASRADLTPSVRANARKWESLSCRF